MITVREATLKDVPGIREVFLATYGTDYSDPRYYDEAALTRLVYSEDNLLLVAVDEADRVLGTASVVLEIGAYSDLVAEFGRLAVHPDARNKGVGGLLMDERLCRVRDRLQVALIDARVTHPFTLKIAEAHGFAPVGFLPLVWQLRERESLLILARYFGNSLELRKNHPRVIPEVAPLAHLALEHCRIAPDPIVDEDASAYPPGWIFQLQDLTTEGYTPLLRIERGRVRRREIFGPLRLHDGMFLLQARRSRYLIAREDGRLVGAIGFTHSPADRTVRVFELIALHDGVVRFLLTDLERACREEWNVCFIEADVSAYAPQMQRTLIELGFLPAAYIPALAFHETERLDAVRMVRLFLRPEVDTDAFPPRSRAMADVVLRAFLSRSALPRIVAAIRGLSLCAGLDEEQVHRLAGVCVPMTFAPGDVIFREGQPGGAMHLLLSGEVAVTLSGALAPLATVRTGECLGELSLLTREAHSATATAMTAIETAVLGAQDLAELVRLRPDIGLVIYRNLATEIGRKLKRR
jgi:CRP-like cAMP-binding protein/GNAT superfamily N-acetyltransferase